MNAHLFAYNEWRTFIHKAHRAENDSVRANFSYIAAIWQMEYVTKSAIYWQGVKP
jgi:hypothetical protein